MRSAIGLENPGGRKLTGYLLSRNLTGNRNICHTVIMSETITVGRRGSITIPAKLRRAFGVQQNDQLIAEQTPEGILLKPSVSIPVEMYTEERIAEFASDEEALRKRFGLSKP